MGETLRVGTHLDIESELNLIKEARIELEANCSTEKAERKSMKELGLKRLETEKYIRKEKQQYSYAHV
jgi:fatty acyl-CoA reductase